MPRQNTEVVAQSMFLSNGIKYRDALKKDESVKQLAQKKKTEMDGQLFKSDYFQKGDLKSPNNIIANSRNGVVSGKEIGS